MIAAMILAAAAAPVPAPSFDCTRAATYAEQTICADPDLALRDRALAAAYARSLALGRREQPQWLAARDACATQACLIHAYDRRIYELMFSGPPGRNAFRRREAELEMIALGDGAFAFSVHALRTYRGGQDSNEAGGLVRIADGRGEYSDGERCRLDFARIARGWRVRELSACYLSGERAPLTGDYLR